MKKNSEIDFFVVSDRGDQYLSDAFGPMENIVPNRSYRLCIIILHMRFSIACPENKLKNLCPPTVFETFRIRSKDYYKDLHRMNF